ncbi:MAG: hypothetical protein ACRDJC_20365 [Thermomicrobiales bacterium]
MPATGWLQTAGRSIGWRLYGLSFAAMLTLAGVDMLGAVLANEWAPRHHPVGVVAGLAAFALLFAVYAARRHVAELAVVTLGWIVFLQDGLQAIDHVRYGVSFPPGTSLAIAAILVLQAYLVLAPNGGTT